MARPEKEGIPMADGVKVIRYRDLEPAWNLLKAKEPGNMRWLFNWVGGGDGYINFNPSVAARSERYVVGLMWLPKGNRQPGVHVHSVTEIYVVVSGELEGVDGSGEIHRAGPLDCMYTPPGVLHGVRSCGHEDAYFVWLHDRLEREGTSVYSDIGAGRKRPGRMHLVEFKSLEPSWDGPGAKEAGFSRWTASYVVGKDEKSTDQQVVSDKVALGVMVLLPGNRQPSVARPFATTYVPFTGGIVGCSASGTVDVGRLDAVYVPAGVPHHLRNYGDAPASIFWVNDRAIGLDHTETRG